MPIPEALAQSAPQLKPNEVWNVAPETLAVVGSVPRCDRRRDRLFLEAPRDIRDLQGRKGE